MIAENLPAAYAKGDNVEARFNMSLGATLAGMAFGSGGLGIVHALSNPLGIEYHMSHGRANAVILPYVVDSNRIGSLNKYARITQAMGENVEGLSAYEAAEKLVTCLNRLLDGLNIPRKISAYGVSRKDIPKLVESSMKLERLFIWNPRNLTKEDVTNIYIGAL